MLIIYIVIAIITVLYLYIRHRHLHWKNHGIPFLEPTIPFGNLKDVGKTVHMSQRFYEIYTQLKSPQFQFVGLYFFIRPVILPTNLDLIRNILIKDFNNFSSRKLYYNEEDDPLSGHLVNLDGQKWKVLRNKVSPTFTSGKMKFMFPVVVKVGQRLSEKLHEYIADNCQGNESCEIEMREFFARYTTDVIGTCAFGIECNSLNDPKAKFREFGMKIFNERRYGPIVKFLTDAFPGICKKLHVKCERDDVSEFFMNALKETIEYREKNNVTRNDFLDIMIKYKNSENLDEKLTFNEIAAQAYIFFGAGFETSSTTLTYCIYELAKNPTIQQRARDEIHRILKKYNGELTYDALMDMTYVHQIIDETLRKYPPAHVLLRTATEDYNVPEMNYTIKKNSLVIIPTYSIHHDPEVYENPNIFDPNRFLPEAVRERHPCAYLPFGEGPRHCIGMRFGKMQTYIGLVSLLKDLKFSNCSRTITSIKYKPEVLILTIDGEMILKVEKYNK